MLDLLMFKLIQEAFTKNVILQAFRPLFHGISMGLPSTPDGMGPSLNPVDVIVEIRSMTDVSDSDGAQVLRRCQPIESATFDRFADLDGDGLGR